MQYLAILAMGIGLTLLGLHLRHRRSRPLSHAFITKLIFVSFGTAAAASSVAFPVAWLAISIALRGGTVESNLPPGFDLQGLLGILLVGAAMTLAYALIEYAAHVRSRR